MAMLNEIMMRLRALFDKADVQGIPRISITFDTPCDKAFFEAEIKRELAAENLTYVTWPSFNFGEATIHGIKVRIL